MQIIKDKNILKYIKLLIFLFIFSFLIFQANYNLSQIYENLENNFSNILLIVLLHIVYLNCVCLRIFLVFKIGLKKFLFYFEWMKLYFESLNMNIVASHTGTAYRAYVLKKNGVKYSDFLSFFYILFFSYFLFNLFYILLELIYFLNGDFKLKIYYLIILSLFCIVFFLLPNLILFLINFTKKIFSRKVFSYIYKIQNSMNLMFKYLIKNKDILKTLVIFGFIFHIFEISLFYLSFSIFNLEFSISTFLILFAIFFVLDRLPIIRDIPGFSEILFATATIPFGFDFTYSFLSKFLLRFTGILSSGLNYIFSLIAGYFLIKK
jgi:hypothetical protein